MKKNMTNTEIILEKSQEKKGPIKNIGIEDNLQENIKNIEKILKKVEITKFKKMIKAGIINIEIVNQKIIQKMIMAVKNHIES
jgi:predicted Zn-dependent protease